jgi:release factor H-coupled RctB family protein
LSDQLLHEKLGAPCSPGISRGEVRVLASQNTWIEGSAVAQLEKTAELPGMKLAVGLPDLHPGKGSPIGAAFAAEGWIYPALVGNDIGCGIGLWRTELNAAKPKREVWADRLHDLDGAWGGDAREWLASRGIPPANHESSLGTIGSGNHFAELQAIETMENPALCAQLGLAKDSVYLCVHSGSRGFGEAILRDHFDRHGTAGIPAGSEESARYLERHDHAMRWASANRELIAARMLERLRSDGTRIVDICHNWVERRNFAGGLRWLHRKGAAPSTQGAVVIPGSRGAFSYLVMPKHPTEGSAFSLAHGAGRKWSRTDSRAKLEKRYSSKDLARTELGSHVICEDKALLYEEAPQAYKNIATVIDDLVALGLIEVIAVLKPLVTYKVRR